MQVNVGCGAPQGNSKWLNEAEIYDSDELLKRLGIGPKLLKTWLDMGLPRIVAGHKHLFYGRRVAAWLDDNLGTTEAKM